MSKRAQQPIAVAVAALAAAPAQRAETLIDRARAFVLDNAPHLVMATMFAGVSRRDPWSKPPGT